MRLISLVDPRQAPSTSGSLELDRRLAPGFCLYVEFRERKFLVDVGNYWSTTSHNAQCLGIDLSDIDFVIISHLHADHIGALAGFLEENSKATIYVRPGNAVQYVCPLSCVSMYIGPSTEVQKAMQKHSYRIFLTTEPVRGRRAPSEEELTCFEIIEGVSAMSVSVDSYVLPAANAPIMIWDEESRTYQRDTFEHEQVIVFRGVVEDGELVNEDEDGDTLVVVSPCSHKGILNIVQGVLTEMEQISDRPVSGILLFGGFHFQTGPLFFEEKRNIQDIGDELLKGFDQKVKRTYTWHCTGSWGFSVLEDAMSEATGRVGDPRVVRYLEAGAVVEIQIT